MAVPPIIEALRAATGAAHQRLDQSMRIEARIADPAARRRMVSAFRRFHAHAEARMRPALEGVRGLDMATRSRLARIDAEA